MSENEFTQILKEVQKIDASSKESKAAFTQQLSSAFKSTKDVDAKIEFLNLARRAEMFGFGFGKIEYRETAEEYERVVGLAVKGYAVQSDVEKTATLEKLLSNENELNAVIKGNAFRSAVKDGEAMPYDPKDATPIAYQTLKRMELAREFPDMIDTNVLAECKGAHNMLEAVFVQRLAEEGGKRPVLGVVPLFEDPETMRRVEKIMESAYKSDAYQAHLGQVAEAQHPGKRVQQVQIAHSDNARRTGLQGARGFIHRAHKVLREGGTWNKQNPGKKIDELQFFEGGSISDAYRNGVRSVSETVDDFSLHHFAKFTFQGGDLVNYFNQPGSITRLLTRTMTHGAKNERDTRHGNGVDGAEKWRTNNVADDVAIAALTGTLHEYEAKDFPDPEQKNLLNKMGVLLTALGYKDEAFVGNIGSRSASRTGGVDVEKPMVVFDVDKKTDNITVQMGAAFTPVKPYDVRTIGFSEAFQHNGLVPSWIGSDALEEHLKNAISRQWEELHKKKTDHTKDEKEFLEQFTTKEGGPPTELNREQLAWLYHRSPAFRDAQDRAAYGIAMTDPDALNAIKDMFTRTEPDLKPSQLQAYKQWGHSYMDRLGKTFTHAGSLVEMALWRKNGENGKATQPNGVLPSFQELIKRDKQADIREAVIQALPLENQIRIKDAYRDFLMYMKPRLKRDDPEIYWAQRGLIHNAGDTVVHGRMLAADDPRFGRAQRDLIKKGLNGGNGEVQPDLAAAAHAR